MRQVLSTVSLVVALLWGTSTETSEIKLTSLPYALYVYDGGIACRSTSKVEFSCKGSLMGGGICPFKIGVRSYRADLTVAASSTAVEGGSRAYSYRFRGIVCAVTVPSFVSGYRCSDGPSNLDCTICVRLPFFGNLCFGVRAALVYIRD